MFINECDKRWGLNVKWIEADVNPEKGIGTKYKLVDFETASRNGEPFDAVIDKYGLPNSSYPHCTRELKEVPIKKFCKNTFGKNYKMAIEIRFDEQRRVNQKRSVRDNWIYPLVFDFPTSKSDVLEFWAKKDFGLNLFDFQGNCDLCWKKSLKKRLSILKDNPTIGDWWADKESKSEYIFDRDKNPVVKLLEMAKETTINKEDLISEMECSCFSNNSFDD